MSTEATALHDDQVDDDVDTQIIESWIQPVNATLR